MKTFRIGDLVCYEDHFVKARSKAGNLDFWRSRDMDLWAKARNVEDDGQFVGTIIGWSKDSDGRTLAKIQWFDWFKTGPAETEEYFSEIQLISGES